MLVVAVTGIDRKPVEALPPVAGRRRARRVQGTLWITSKMRLDNDGETRALARRPHRLGHHHHHHHRLRRAATTTGRRRTTTTSVEPPVRRRLRQQALARLIAEPGTLAALVSAGFLAYEPPSESSESGGDDIGPARRSARSRWPAPGSWSSRGRAPRWATTSSPSPWPRSWPRAAGRAVAAEAGQDTDGGRAVFVGLLRRDATANGKVSTVDNLESPMGQAAVVLALEELGESRVGHFGVGPGAQRLLPALPA